MSRAVGTLPAGSRVTDYISLGVIAKTFPLDTVQSVLRDTGRSSQRRRALPAPVMVYYVIALALYMQSSYREVLRCLLEGVQWLAGPSRALEVAGKSGISQARTRLGWEPLRRLHGAVVKPIADRASKGAWYGRWRLVSLDGSTLDVADEASNAAAFGRPGASRGRSAFPQLRFVSLVENGTHVLFASEMAGYGTSEITLAKAVLRPAGGRHAVLGGPPVLRLRAVVPGARQGGRPALARQEEHAPGPRPAIARRLLPEHHLFLGTGSPPPDRRAHGAGDRLPVGGCRRRREPVYRLLTTILDHDVAPAHELAALYHERWEIETALDELKTHLRGARIVLRSKTPDLVRQEFYGLMMAHFAIRSLIHEAALKADEDPDRLSFVHAVRVVRRKLPAAIAIPPSEEQGLP